MGGRCEELNNLLTCLRQAQGEPWLSQLKRFYSGKWCWIWARANWSPEICKVRLLVIMGIGSKENTTRPEFTIAQGIDYEAPKKLVDPKSGLWVQNCPLNDRHSAALTLTLVSSKERDESRMRAQWKTTTQYSYCIYVIRPASCYSVFSAL